MKKIKKYGCYIIPFLIPWLLIVVHSIVRGSWLTGQGGLLNGDTGSQLYPLVVELWNKVHSDESLFYSWNSGSGFDFYLNMIYYLLSPFTLIILLLPKACIENAVQFVMVLKWSLMGVSITYYFLHTRYNTLTEHKRLVSSALGIVFALSNAVLTIFGYFNWGDVIILFPLILLALEKLIEEGNWKKYYILLTVAMLCNFYMAYQVCIFLVLWFFIHMNGNVSDKLKKILSFTGSSLLAALSSCVVIVPAALGAANRYNGRDFATWINNIWGVGERLFLFSDNLLDWTSYKPNLYFSVGFFVLAVLFFFVKIDRREKLKVLLVWLFMMISLFSGILTVFWHGFSVPYGVYHRYLFMLIFLMLYMAMKVVTHLQDVQKWQLCFATVVDICFMVACFFHITKLNSFYGYLITFLLLILYNLLLYFYLKGSIQYKNIIVVVIVFVMLEMGANAFYELKEYDENNWADTYYNDEAEEISKDIQLNKGERVSMPDSPYNMGLALNLPSTNQFISYKFDNMIDLYNNLGMEFDSSSMATSGTSPLLNLMFNIRYGICDWNGDVSDEELVKTTEHFNLYRLDRLAGLGYMVNKEVTDWDTDNYINFDVQNDFVKKSTDVDGIFTAVMPDAEFKDGILGYKCDESNYAKGFYYYDYISKNTADMEMTEFSFTVDEDMDLYLDAFSQKAMTNIIYVDDEAVCQDSVLRIQGYYHIGQVKKGQKIHIYSTHSMGVGEEAVLWFRFAKFNEENYAKAYEKLSKNVYNIDNMDSAYISGTIHADEDGIMMTSVPAMKGFTVLVDGKAVSTKTIGNAFIGVPLSKGDHKVEFKYMTPYFKQGALISLFGVVIFVVLCIYDNRRKKKEA